MTRLAAILCATLFSGVAMAQDRPPLTINGGTIGELRANQIGAIILPEGRPPFPAVIVMHGCNGMTEVMATWARRLASWGYAALTVDSFGPRGIKNVCGGGLEFPSWVRARDAFTAADYLRTRRDIDHDHIGLVGFSHGGSTVLAASTEKLVAENGGKPFAAVVSYYPYCPKVAPQFVSKLQILIGDADDWSPPQRCADLITKYADTDANRPLLKIYPGVWHSFENDRPDRMYFGHHLVYDPKAAADSFAVTKAFFDSHLRH